MGSGKVGGLLEAEATIREWTGSRMRRKWHIKRGAPLKVILPSPSATVQSQDTNQAMQEEREAWQKENIALRDQLEKVRRERSSLSSQQQQEQQDTTSPSEQQATKSPSPMLSTEEAYLEMSMIKVHLIPTCRGEIIVWSIIGRINSLRMSIVSHSTEHSRNWVWTRTQAWVLKHGQV